MYTLKGPPTITTLLIRTQCRNSVSACLPALTQHTPTWPYKRRLLGILLVVSNIQSSQIFTRLGTELFKSGFSLITNSRGSVVVVVRGNGNIPIVSHLPSTLSLASNSFPTPLQFIVCGCPRGFGIEIAIPDSIDKCFSNGNRTAAYLINFNGQNFTILIRNFTFVSFQVSN